VRHCDPRQKIIIDMFTGANLPRFQILAAAATTTQWWELRILPSLSMRERASQRGAQPLLIPLSCMLNMEGTKAFVPCSWINKKLQNALENIFRQRVWAYGSADPLRVASRVGCSDMQHNHRATLCVRGLCCQTVSVCLSVRHVRVLYPDNRTCCWTSFLALNSFWHCAVIQFQSAGALNTPGEFAIFDCLSRKRYEIGQWLLRNINRNS